MTQSVDAAVAQAHADVVALFRDTPVTDAAGLAAVCRAARDRLTAMPVPDPHDPHHWDAYRVLTPTVQSLLGYAREAGDPSGEAARFRALLIGVLHYLYDSRRAAAGIPLAELVQRDWEEHLGETHPDTIVALERLAACRHDGEGAEQSRPVLERIVRLRSQSLGADHPDTLHSLCNLGVCLNTLGDYREALRLNSETLQRCERHLGSDNWTTNRAMNVTASSLFGLGEHSSALFMYRAVHRWHLQRSGASSLDTLDAAADVAHTLHALGDYEAARTLNADLLHIYERTAGKDYHGTQQTRARLTQNLEALRRDA
ncbi:tetratricopeptide repeat protein [Streptomyces sp. NBC_01445]|uniref:tetratricopeptide repeat protein n=1 Tax=Streptomyces sp. NBC_01445 TaxID=2903869 RepID=UPI002DDC0939|nr:tetratricopeptide repeat protein [Streptomyces sp. NBC_01445]WSE01983.1 tetratricopeptide repeat protein [Streptomyces sp. NBC_01445]WSE10348.1 tetratricopeptide repeat protein [Streptomyces sp. NBC_01445]WSE11086.1 tetratricopeptide repeat protein [Streptomyces sp. NBC_01445]